MAEESSPMHEKFPRWYRAVDIGDDRGLMERRWVGVTTLVESASRPDIEALVRLAFKTRQAPAADALQNISKAFKDSDPEFTVEDNARELEVLSGASLAILFEQGAEMAAIAALATTTAALAGARKPNLPMDLVALAEEAICDTAQSARQRPDISRHASADAPKFDFEKAAAKYREAANPDGMAQAFTLAAEATRSALGALAKRQATALQSVNKFIKIQDEELQMLWWLVGQRSHDLDCGFDMLSAEAQPFVLSKELADMTEFLPGPASVKALLSRAGLKERKKLPLSSLVNGADPTWLSKVIDGVDISPVTQPIHFGIQRQLETSGGTAWVAGWVAAAGLEADPSLSPLTIGVQFYRERLLATFE